MERAKRRFCYSLLCVLGLILFIDNAWVDPMHWRYWKAVDGLGESYTRTVSVGPSGKVWANHGQVDFMSCLDGYSTLKIPKPNEYVGIYEGPSGELWSIFKGGLQQYKEGAWIRYPIPEIQDITIPFVPNIPNHALFLLPSGLLDFDAETGQTQRLKQADQTGIGPYSGMLAARDGGLWVLGERGIAKIPNLAGFAPGGEWKEYLLEKEGFREPSYPAEGDNGNLFMAAKSTATQKNVFLFLEGESITSLYESSARSLRGWGDNPKRFWLLEDQELSRFENGRRETIEGKDALSGIPFDVAASSGGVFWIATSQGLTRYAPPIWMTPAPISDVKTIVHNIYEDGQGRLWFAGQDKLIQLNNDQWKIYPLPADQLTHHVCTESLCSLPDGRMVLKLSSTKLNYLLVFNPEKETFESIPHPSGQWIVSVHKAADGKIWVQTRPPDEQDRRIQLELFDGKTFTPFLNGQNEWDIGGMRYLFQESNDKFWFGGITGLGLFSKGAYRSLRNEEGFPGDSSFCIHPIGDGKIWFGGRDSIYQYDGSRWSLIRSGLDAVRSMITSKDGRIWVASGTGLHQYFEGSWITNTEEDGLPSSIVYEVFEDSQGRIWAGTTKGLSLYFSKNDREPPDTQIINQSDMREVAPSGNVQFLLSGMDKWKYTLPERMYYSYRMDEKPWSPYQMGDIGFSDLAPGTHQIQVRAMDRNWNVDPTPAEFTFSVLLPWYKTPGFLLIVSIGSLVILVLLAYAVSRYMWMERLVEQRTVELARREALYRTLVENLKQNVFLKDREGVFLSGNSCFCELIGLPLDRIIGKTDFDLFPPDLAKKYRDDDRRIMETGETLHLIEENETGRERKWVETVKTPIADEQGTVSGILGIFWDISERIHHQEALHKNQELLEITQKVAHVGSWCSDLVTWELTWSAETYRIFGVDVSRFDGNTETFFSLIHPQDTERVRAKSLQAIANREPYQIDHRIIRPDGVVRWVYERAEIVVDQDGAPIQMVGTVQDITEQKQAEEAIQSLAKFPDENPNPVMRVSREGILLFANKPSEPLLDFWGIRRGEPIPPVWRNHLQEACTSYTKKEMEIVHEKRTFSLVVSPIPDADYMNIYGVDVTEKKRLEEQFRQAQKMEAIGQLAGGVAHDFNNLILAIQGYSQFLLNDLPSNSGMRNDVDEIMKAASRAASLTRQLLAFSRKQVLQPVSLDVNNLISDMKKMLHRLIGENIDLITNLDPDLGIIKADPGQIEQVIMNLAVNSRDAMPDGGRLSLETKNVDLDESYMREHDSVEPGAYVMLAVSDTGHGMDKATIQRIFDPFFTTKDVGKGTGLGLSTVYGIVKQSGGNIWVYSETGKGTVFKIYFPRIETPVESKPDISTISTPPSRSAAILLVEDEEVVRNMVLRILISHGFDVLAARNGNEALQMCQGVKKPIHLVITDVIMPEMSGSELAHNLSISYPNIKVLFMSGYTNNEIVHHGVLDPEVNFIQKPFTIDRFLEKIQEILD